MLIFSVFPIKSEAEFSVNLSDLDAIHIFQCKEGVHESKIGVNVRNIDCSGTDTEDLCHFFDQISFRGSGFCLVLRHTDIRSLSKESKKFAKLLLFHTFSVSEKFNPNAIGISPFPEIFYPFLNISSYRGAMNRNWWLTIFV